jgi:hypothetical protein
MKVSDCARVRLHVMVETTIHANARARARRMSRLT